MCHLLLLEGVIVHLSRLMVWIQRNISCGLLDVCWLRKRVELLEWFARLLMFWKLVVKRVYLVFSVLVLKSFLILVFMLRLLWQVFLEVFFVGVEESSSHCV